MGAHIFLAGGQGWIRAYGPHPFGAHVVRRQLLPQLVEQGSHPEVPCKKIGP